jgi:hypothetical protein
MEAGCREMVSRREFLKSSAALGVTAITQGMVGAMSQPTQAVDGGVTPEPSPTTRVPADDGLDHHLYLPLVSGPGGVAHGASKLGLHTLKPNNAFGFVEAVHDAGAYVALVKALDDFGYLRRVKETSEQTTTVARVGPSRAPQAVDASDDPVQKAAWLMEKHMPFWRFEQDVVDYWEVLNENKPPTIAGHVWLAEFFIAAMDIAEANGHRLALFSYSTGVPQWHEWEAIVETGVFARAKAGGHALALHEYDWPVIDRLWGEPTEDLPPYEDRGVLAGRYRHLYRDFLIPRDEVVPLVITECGLDPVVNLQVEAPNWREWFVEDMIWYDTKLREDDYVVGAAMFSVGTHDNWIRYDYEELLWPGNPHSSENFYDYVVSLKDA